MNTPTSGVVELAHDWRARHLPPIRFSGGLRGSLARLGDHSFANASGYFVTRREQIFFVLPGGAHPRPFARRAPVYLAGDFNGWGEAIGREEWRLNEASLDGQPVLLWCGAAAPFLADPPLRFKFVTGEGRWFDVPADAPNVQSDDGGNRNRIVDPNRTGLHLYAFSFRTPIDVTHAWRVHWAGGDGDHSVPLRFDRFYHELATDLPLGARVEQGRTVFRLFAPRAWTVTLGYAPTTEAKPTEVALARRAAVTSGEGAVWEAAVDQDLHGSVYWYRLDGPRDEFSAFDPERRVLDPYAFAALGREGPGLVIDLARFPRPADGFQTPAWQDLVICEAHVRDLTALAPVAMPEVERRGFAGLSRWVESPGSYLDRLGVNCVELLPVQQFDGPDEYHWGYMTTNFFAPHHAYATDPARGSGIPELQALVAAMHRRGMAVLLDVVYNHVGEPAHLLFIDKHHYFVVDRHGALSNWSGCGNDLRADSAMARRLIIDSCVHLLQVFGVDGFRFDLAELLGLEALQAIEVALKRVKPDVILIAEPWSFRGHIAGPLGATGWASWNDGYRRFLKDYVRGGASHEAFEYFLKGSPWHFAHWPAQTVNYVESHDDRTWIDEITENADGNGHLPTANDRRRTHLMAAVLMCSIGIPMLAAGQDFLRSKHGVSNTYLRGDLNALDYRRLERFPGSHGYFADWIAFRRSPTGRLLRHFSRASEGFFKFWFAPESPAAVVLYNADRSEGPEQLLFAVNPSLNDVEVPFDPVVAAGPWQHLADHERFLRRDAPGVVQPLAAPLWLPSLGCGLWHRRD